MEIVPKGSNRSPVPEKRAKRTNDLEELCGQCKKAFGWVISTLTDNPGSRTKERRLGCEDSSDHIGPDLLTGLIANFGKARGIFRHLERKLYVHGGTETNFRKAKDGSAFNKIEFLWIPSSWIDYDWLREKLNHCILEHRKCHSSGKSITKLRLIDVEGEGQLEDFEQGQEIDYIALSYVWGTSSCEPGDRKKFEPEPLIKDAMIVTKRLGYKYLWVDRYCIKDGEDHKQLMINQMDRVYSKACATIIASTCDSAQDHLPGVHSPPQGEQVEFGKVTFVKLGDIPDEVLRSKWASRGWTYQEAYLSQRRLIFTQGGVIFLCNQECLRETQRDYYGSFLDERESPHDFSWMLPGGNNALARLQSQITQYSQRNLTFEEDLLRAFQGVMRHYETSGTAELISHLWGLPISYNASANHVPRDNARITICLAWSHKQPTKERRKNFPSWSWTGWAGMVESLEWRWADLYSEQKDIASSISDTMKDPASAGQLPWHIEVGDADRRSTLSQYIHDHTSQVCRPSEQEAMNVWQPRELWITSYVIELRFHYVPANSEEPERIFAKLPMGESRYLNLEPRLDREVSTETGSLGVILPMDGGGFWQKDEICWYNIVILHKISKTKFERAGLLRFRYNAEHGLTSEQFRRNPMAEPRTAVNGSQNDFPFLKDATWKTICLV
ncbi:hypothetical protein G7054_g4627 [Neopestalotiopsis clavispora]|nr:hypothetical protein G7054_g4627 [Neopestalotiopsis clavispora]